MLAFTHLLVESGAGCHDLCLAKPRRQVDLEVASLQLGTLDYDPLMKRVPLCGASEAPSAPKLRMQPCKESQARSTVASNT